MEQFILSQNQIDIHVIVPCVLTSEAVKENQPTLTNNTSTRRYAPRGYLYPIWSDHASMELLCQNKWLLVLVGYDLIIQHCFNCTTVE